MERPLIPAKPQIAALFPKGKTENVSCTVARLPEQVQGWKEHTDCFGEQGLCFGFPFSFLAGLDETQRFWLIISLRRQALGLTASSIDGRPSGFDSVPETQILRHCVPALSQQCYVDECLLAGGTLSGWARS